MQHFVLKSLVGPYSQVETELFRGVTVFSCVCVCVCVCVCLPLTQSMLGQTTALMTLKWKVWKLSVDAWLHVNSVSVNIQQRFFNTQVTYIQLTASW